MTPAEIIAIAAALGAVAMIYSMVGLGGGSGYLMVMGIAGLAPEVMRPTSLVLNLLVAGIGLVRFSRAGGFRGQALWPFLIMSLPCSFIGGAIRVDAAVYRFLVAALLLFAAYRLALKTPAKTDGETVKAVPWPAALVLGAAIGLVSGLIGIGGGILLGPVILLFGWATARQTAGVTAAFVLINSAAALAGFVVGHRTIPVEPGVLAVFLGAVLVCGLIGSWLGARRLGHVAMRRVLAAILVFASVKMIFESPGAPPEVHESTAHDDLRGRAAEGERLP
jgi:uncharacterized membrane protein YfcA